MKWQKWLKPNLTWNDSWNWLRLINKRYFLLGLSVWVLYTKLFDTRIILHKPPFSQWGPAQWVNNLDLCFFVNFCKCEWVINNLNFVSWFVNNYGSFSFANIVRLIRLYKVWKKKQSVSTRMSVDCFLTMRLHQWEMQCEGLFLWPFSSLSDLGYLSHFTLVVHNLLAFVHYINFRASNELFELEEMLVVWSTTCS